MDSEVNAARPSAGRSVLLAAVLGTSTVLMPCPFTILNATVLRASSDLLLALCTVSSVPLWSPRPVVSRFMCTSHNLAMASIRSCSIAYDCARAIIVVPSSRRRVHSAHLDHIRLFAEPHHVADVVQNDDLAQFRVRLQIFDQPKHQSFRTHSPFATISDYRLLQSGHMEQRVGDVIHYVHTERLHLLDDGFGRVF